jgi:hypothetical protein
VTEPETTGEGAPSGASDSDPETDRYTGLGAEAPIWWADGDVTKCSACGRTRPHTIRRIPGTTPVCDDCHEGTKP